MGIGSFLGAMGQKIQVRQACLDEGVTIHHLQTRVMKLWNARTLQHLLVHHEPCVGSKPTKQNDRLFKECRSLKIMFVVAKDGKEWDGQQYKTSAARTRWDTRP